MKKLLTVTIASLLASSVVFAGDTYLIKHVEKAPIIDANDSDIAWGEADTLTQFTFPWDTKLAPATEFKAVWDDEAVYFRFRVDDKHVTIGEGERGALDSDRVEIFLAKNHDLEKYYTMEIDAEDQIYSAVGTFDTKINKRTSLLEYKWEGLKTSSKITEYGYLVEGSIPMDTLTNMQLWQNKEKTELICALMRAEFTKTESGIDMGWIAWNDPKLPKPAFHNPKSFGTCKLVK
ncbi:TPA: carbohydrate-binding family 9-like protein [Vibrio metschnikovii]